MIEATTLNFDLVLVGFVIAGMGVLGFTALISNRKSAATRAFFLFTLMAVFWSVINYAFYHLTSSTVAFWDIRLEIFTATWLVLFLFQFLYAFPEKEGDYPIWYRFLLVPCAGAISILTLTPYVFERVTSVGANGVISGIQNGPGIFIFAAFTAGTVFSGLFIFVQKMRKTSSQERGLFRPILIGLFITFACLLIFNLTFPAFLGITAFIPLGALFILPTVLASAYAIRVQHLFNVKVFTTAALVVLLCVVTSLEVITATSGWQLILQGSVFLLVLIFGINLIRGVLREVQQREEIQKLAEELQETNKRQEGLIHFIGHEVKAFLTKAQGVFSLLEEGDLGPVPEAMKPFIDRGLKDTEDGVTSVSDILKASNLKRGTVEYKKEDFDLKTLVAESVEKARQGAEAKGLKLSLTAEEGDFPFKGDRGEIGDHVFRNLIDNSVNYTPTGSIEVSLKKINGNYIFAVKDTGVGITEEDKKRLFTEGGHGKDSQRVNVHSTGYGLFIAKQVVEAHGGTVRAESEGPDKGSTFIVELSANPF